MATPNQGFSVVSRQIKPIYQEDTYPVVADTDLFGGLRVIPNASALSTIPLPRMTVGMLAVTQDTGLIYQLQSISPSIVWTLFISLSGLANKCLISNSPTIANGNITLTAYPGTVVLAPTTGNSASNGMLLLIFNNSGLVSNVFVHGVTFDGGGSNFANTTDVIHVQGADRVVFDAVTIQNTRGLGLGFVGTIIRSGIRNSTFTNIGNHWKTTLDGNDRFIAMIFCCAATITPSHDDFIQDNTFNDIGLDGTDVGDALYNLTVTGNVYNMFNNEHNLLVTNNSAMNAAFYINPNSKPESGITYSGNTVNGPSGACIDLFQANGVSVTGNTMVSCGGPGIGLFQDTNMTVTGNTVLDSIQWTSSPFFGGITVSGPSSNITVSGNTATDDQTVKTQKYGIQVVSGAAYSNVWIDNSNNTWGNLIAPVLTDKTVNTLNSPASSDNRILNPCFAINQILETSTFSGGSGYVSDQWTVLQNSGLTWAQDSTINMGSCYTSSEKIVVASQATPSAGDFRFIDQPIEGTSLSDLNWGSAQGQSVIFDYCARAPVNNFVQGWVLQNNNAAKGYAGQDTLTTANTVYCFTHLVPGDVSGGFLNAGAAKTLTVIFDLGTGSSNVTSTVGSWISGTFFGVTGDTAIVAQTNGSAEYISGVRLYPNQRDVTWQRRSYTDELARLQRYYVKSFSPGTVPALNAGAATGERQFAAGIVAAGTELDTRIQFPVQMFSAPSITFFNPSAANANCRDETAAADGGAATSANVTANGMNVSCTGNATTVVGNKLGYHYIAKSQM